MKKFGLVFFFLKSIPAIAQLTNKEVPARFVYSHAEFDTFIAENMVRPPEAIKYGINAAVDFEFDINPDASISNVNPTDIRIVPSDNASGNQSSDTSLKSKYLAEGERLLYLTEGLWIPGKANGMYIRTHQVETIRFNTRKFFQNQKDISKEKIKGLVEWIKYGGMLSWNNNIDTSTIYEHMMIRPPLRSIIKLELIRCM